MNHLRSREMSGGGVRPQPGPATEAAARAAATNAAQQRTAGKSSSVRAAVRAPILLLVVMLLAVAPQVARAEVPRIIHVSFKRACLGQLARLWSHALPATNSICAVWAVVRLAKQPTKPHLLPSPTLLQRFYSG
jgi:hypothetical protein